MADMTGETLTAAELVEQLRFAYEAFQELAGEKEKSKTGMTGFFGKLFQSAGSSEPEPHCAEFLAKVQALVGQLEAALRGADADARDALVSEAADIMLAKKPIENKSPAEWYMVAAEYGFSALVPHLSGAALGSVRDHYASSYPKRMMYPRQRELLKRMEQGLQP